MSATQHCYVGLHIIYVQWRCQNNFTNSILITVCLSELLNQLPVSMRNWTISTSSRPTWLSYNFYLAICTLNKTLQPGHVPWLDHFGATTGVGAEQPRTWGGSSLNLGRNDRVCGAHGADRLRGGSTGTRLLRGYAYVDRQYKRHYAPQKRITTSKSKTN